MKNILVFSLAYYPVEGGAEIALRETMGRLRNFNFYILTHRFHCDHPAFEEKNNVKIFRLGRGGLNPHDASLVEKILFVFRAYCQANILEQERSFSLIWSMMAAYAGVAARFFKGKYPDKPLFVSIQEGDSEEHMESDKLGLINFWIKRIVRRADCIQVISNYLKDFIFKKGARCPIVVIPNGVNLELFDKDWPSEDLVFLKNRLGIKDGEKVVITTSRLAYKNGVDTLIRAVALLDRLFKLLIVGEGADRAALEGLTQSLDLTDRVIFVGSILQSQLPLYLKLSDVFVRPSRSEGLGNSFLEAMAAGVPIIGTAVGGIPDFLKDCETGWFVPVDDPAATAAKIQSVLANKTEAQAVVQKARLLVREKYSWDQVAAWIGEIINSQLR